MNRKPPVTDPLTDMELGPDQLRSYFIIHLNKIYSAKSHLAERLPEIAVHANFKDLKHAIAETIDDVERQIARMEEIYLLLDTPIQVENCSEFTGMVEDAYDAIHEQEDNLVLRDLSILFYMQNIESVEMASFQVLKMVAVKLKNKQLTQLLTENFDEAKEDRALLLLITKKYLTS